MVGALLARDVTGSAVDQSTGVNRLLGARPCRWFTDRIQDCPPIGFNGWTGYFAGTQFPTVVTAARTGSTAKLGRKTHWRGRHTGTPSRITKDYSDE
jgi:hypothetical protein